MTLPASITNVAPSRLFLISWAVKLAGATLKVWRAKPRRKVEA